MESTQPHDQPDAQAQVLHQAKQMMTIQVSPAEHACLSKLKPGEPSFTMVGDDLTFGLTVSFWVRANAMLRDLIAQGQHPSVAISMLKGELDRAFPLKLHIRDVKLLEALDLSMDGEEWPERKVAD